MKWVVGSLLVTAMLAWVTPAHAWGNWGDDFGTHDWVLYHAIDLAASRGASWVETTTALVATDDPDTNFGDFYFHAYDVWGVTYGGGPTMVADRYTEVVRLLKAGDLTAASTGLGRMSHYYSDLCQPLHTDETTREPAAHRLFEIQNATVLTTASANVDWIHDDGGVYVRDPYQYSVSAATRSHASYWTLLNGWFLGGYANGNVQTVTGASLDRAVNDLADLIVTASADAGLTTTSVRPLPAATLTTPAVKRKTARGKVFTFSGVLKPRHKSGTRAVSLYIYESELDTVSAYPIDVWKLRRVVTVAVTNSGKADSKYTASIALPNKGKWRVRAVHSDTGHRWSRSAYRYVTLR